MNILHLSTGDRTGGAAIAAFRLNEAMNSIGLKSKMLVLNKITDSPQVEPIDKYKNKIHKYTRGIRKIIADKLRYYFLKPKLTFSCGVSHVGGIKNNQLIREADVIYIHWAQSTFISINDIKSMASSGKIIYLFLHDMWYLTGGCNSSMGCEYWLDSCSQCPLVSNRYLKNITHYLLKKKVSCFKHDNIKVIAPSSDMINNVHKSVVFKNKEPWLIPNTLNTERFQVIDRKTARRLLGLPTDKKLLLYGAVAGSSNPYKGWGYVDTLMRRMGQDVELVVFGSNNEQNHDYKVHSLGKITDETSLALVYNAVNVYVSPTLAEAFGQTLVESVACGTKAVAFKIGGTIDIIDHLSNGYLVNYMDNDDLFIGVNWALKQNETLEDRENMHQDVINKYSYKTVAGLHKKNINI